MTGDGDGSDGEAGPSTAGAAGRPATSDADRAPGGEAEGGGGPPEREDAGPAPGGGAEDGGAPVERSEAERLYRRGRELVERGELREAAEVYRALLLEKPRHLKARNNLGYVHDRLGEPEEALRHYRKALELDPDNVQLLSNAGALLGDLGR